MSTKSKFGIAEKFMAILLSSLVGIGSTAQAAIKLDFSDEKTHVEEIKIYGDIRLRHENFDNSGPTVDRQRQRARFRVGADVKLPHKLKVKGRVTTTEGGSQTSGNQTLDNNATRKSFDLDLAFVEWTPWTPTKFQGGKVKNPFFKSGTINLIWDGDYNPEGVSESISGSVGSVGLFANFGQFVIEEVAGSLEDAYLFSNEGGAEFNLPADSKLKTVVTHHEFTNIDKVAVGGVGTLGTNTPGARFSILQLIGVLSSSIAGIPIALDATYAKNNAAPKISITGGPAQEEDTAVHAGLIVGKPKKKGDWKAAYFWKEIDRDAVVAGITDADMPNTTNTKGHIGLIAYLLADFVTLQVKHTDAKLKRVAAGSSSGSVKRTQFDLSVKW